MIRLHYSNRTEALLARFVAQLREQRQLTHPLEPVQVIVPNRNMEAYVERGVAEALGVSANLRFARLERFVGGWLERALPDVRIMDRGAFESLLLALFHDQERLAAPPLRDVRAYIDAGGDRDARDVRRVQLARRLGQLFEGYGYTRPELLDAFMRGQLGTEHPDFVGSARFQAALVAELTGPDAPRPVFAPRAHYVPLAAALRTVRAAGPIPSPVPEGLLFPAEDTQRPVLHVFGVSYVARVFQWLYGALGEAAELHLYVNNPCMEFWEDMPSESELRAARRLPKRGERPPADAASMGPLDSAVDTPLALHQEDDPPLLVAFGRPGREHVHLLNELTDADFEPCFVDPAEAAVRAGREPTVLEALQRDVLLRAPLSSPPPAALAPPDGSLRFHACPSVRREVEVVAEQIWRAVRAASDTEHPLGFHQVAVLVPNAAREEYLPHVEAVFAEAHAIPHCVVDLDLASTSRVVDACMGLLELPLGRFTRPEVLALLTHPNVLANLPDATSEQVRALVSELGIFYGVDRTELAGTYVDEDRLNWEQGLLRVALGDFMADARDTEAGLTDGGLADGGLADGGLGEDGSWDDGLRLGDSSYLPVSTDPTWARSFSLLLRGLIADARFARGEPRPLRQWAQFFAGMWEGYVVPETDAEQSELRSCLAAARGLVERDVAGTPVSYRVASMLVTEALSGLTAARGDYLADGVVVSSFLPMRAIPFRQTFVLGLGEGSFPARDTHDTLDLRLERRRIGDVRGSERDKYMFLEVLLSARDAVQLSWVAREPYTGDPIAASAPVRLLLDTLRRSYVREAEGSPLVETHALFRHTPLDPESPFAEAHMEAWLRALGVRSRAALREAAGGDPSALGASSAQQPPSLEEALGALRGQLPPGRYEQLTRELRTISLADGWRADQGLGSSRVELVSQHHTPERGGVGSDGVALDTLHLSRANLARFLEDPQSGWAEALLGVQRATDEEGDESVEDEPFEPSVPTRVVALRQAFWEGHAGGSLERAYDRTVARLQARGEWPVASLARARRGEDLALLGSWGALVSPLVAPRELPQRVRFGEALEDGDVERLLPSLELELDDPRDPQRRLRVLLRGRTEALVGARGSLHLDAAPRPHATRSRARREERAGLRAFLDHLLLSACGEEVAQHHAYVLYPGEERAVPLSLGRLPQALARTYLLQLVTDLLTGPHAYFAPPTPLLEALPEWGTRSPDAWRAALLRVRQELVGRSYASVPHAEEYPVPPAEALHAMYARRYDLYARLRAGEAA
ncbi:MAG: exodeoxyribonuclease V subunit gamma [Myxococcales bacterium]|nr:exodeoxyribonuclease V subunit gamma [Myxococcales bacterium]MCB9628492.1 exodeoxyribonuclease V subunit gamma [Sandaracinaceae bacterium]